MDVKKIDELLLSMGGATKDFKEEWGWDRYIVGGKMFAAVCTPSSKYAKEYAGYTLLSLKCEQAESELLRGKYKDILPGFYMNKDTWISIRLSGEVDSKEIERLAHNSYLLIFSKLTKKLQKQISGTG